MAFTIHIIDIPDTVKHLSFFVQSLLKWSDASLYRCTLFMQRN